MHSPRWETGAVAAILAISTACSVPNIATGSLVDSRIVDWYQEPFIRGAYSYPIVGEGTARADLAASMADRYFLPAKRQMWKATLERYMGRWTLPRRRCRISSM